MCRSMSLCLSVPRGLLTVQQKVAVSLNLALSFFLATTTDQDNKDVIFLSICLYAVGAYNSIKNNGN